jgi:hypothetical protein
MTKFVRGVPAMYLGPVEVADLEADYVPAGNHDLIVKALERDHALVLSGRQGCGRETTAIAAIRQLRPGIRIRRFILEDEDAEEISTRVGCGYLIRVADGDLSRLAGCVDAVRGANGYLVVVADHNTLQLAAAALTWIAVEPPPPVQIYRHWVDSHGFTEWRHWEQAPVLLEQALPADVRRLSELIRQIARPGGDIDMQQAEVAHAYRGWNDELRGWFDKHREPHDRALLVAAAALSPLAEKGCIYSVASSLAQRLQIEINGGGLAWCPVTGLRALLGAQQEDDRIVFHRHGFAGSALRHALADYPLARPDLLAWLAALPTDEAVREGHRNSLAETFADLAAEHGAAECIVDTGRGWGDDGLADLAFIALSRTCLHPRVGGRVRRALYDWSRKARTSQTLKLTIARVCEPLGQTYPSIALTRLKHLATHGNSQVISQVILAVRALAGSDHRKEVLLAILAWCAETNGENLSPRARQRRRRAGATLFLEFAGPVNDSGLPRVLDRDQAVDPERCAPGWRAALDPHVGAGLNAIEDVLGRWLDAALNHARLREQICSVFVMAATGPGIRSDGVHNVGSTTLGATAATIMIGMVRRWAAMDHADPVRRKIKEDIVIPLTQPGWLRLLKVLYVGLRAKIHAVLTR